MNSRIHLSIAITLSMIITCVLYYSLKDTWATGFIFQTTLIVTTCDLLLYIRCLPHKEKSKFVKKMFLYFHYIFLVNKEICEYLFADNE